MGRKPLPLGLSVLGEEVEQVGKLLFRTPRSNGVQPKRSNEQYREDANGRPVPAVADKAGKERQEEIPYEIEAIDPQGRAIPQVQARPARGFPKATGQNRLCVILEKGASIPKADVTRPNSIYYARRERPKQRAGGLVNALGYRTRGQWRAKPQAFSSEVVRQAHARDDAESRECPQWVESGL